MVLPSTKLGYTLGIKRDRDIISPKEKRKEALDKSKMAKNKKEDKKDK